MDKNDRRKIWDEWVGIDINQQDDLTQKVLVRNFRSSNSTMDFLLAILRMIKAGIIEKELPKDCDDYTFGEMEHISQALSRYYRDGIRKPK